MACPFEKRNVSASFVLDCDTIDCCNIENEITDSLTHFDR